MPKKWGIRKIAEVMRGKKKPGQHDCQDTLRKVRLVLDGELTQEEEKNFLHEVNICSQCLEKYHIEKSFKEFLTNKISRKHISTSIVDSIRNQIFGKSSD